MTTVIERPEVRHGMLESSTSGGLMSRRGIRDFVGTENYNEFRKYGRIGQAVPGELQLKFDREIYTKVGELVGGCMKDGESLWMQALNTANLTMRYARGIFFADQDRRGDMITKLAIGSLRPSVGLQRLTTSLEYIGAQMRFEQGRQWTFARSAAEIISQDDNDHAREVFEELDNFLGENLFLGKKDDPHHYQIYSGHAPFTNKLVRTSKSLPELVSAGLWVKELEYPVRNLAIKDSEGQVISQVEVLYDPREKDPASATIKAWERSLKDPIAQQRGGVIEAAPYVKDTNGFRLVIMEGGRPMRDTVISYLDELVRKFDGFDSIEDDDRVDPDHGKEDRVKFRRKQLSIKGLRNPVEIQIFTLEDWLTQEFEVGEFSEEKGMHDGGAHDLYKLEMVGKVAPGIWPFKIHAIPLDQTRATSSYEYADRLGRKQRVA